MKIIVRPVFLLLILLVMQYLGTNLIINKLSWIWVFFFLARACLLILYFIYLLFFFSKIIKLKIAKERLNVITTYYSTFMFIILLEFFASFVTYTNGGDFCFATINWYHVFWKPINSDGFRDNECVRNKEKLAIFIGDSFTSGFGIKNYKHRFSNLSCKNIKYDTWNMGVSGSNTKDQLKLLDTLKVTPDIIFFQYYINDMFQDDDEYTKNKLKQVVQNLSFNEFMMKSSYLYNYIFAKKVEKQTANSDQILEYVEPFLKDHLKDLEAIVKKVKILNSRLYVLFFSSLINPESYEAHTYRIKSEFLKLGVTVIDVEDLIINVPTKHRVVNRTDNHPSVLVNEIVAKKIKELLLEYD